MTATPVLELGTRAPNPTDGLPTSSQYVEAVTLATNALFDYSTGGDEAADFDGDLRVEWDLSLPAGASWTLIDLVDDLRSVTIFKVVVTAGDTRSVAVTVSDGTSSETNTFYGLTAGRLAGKSVRFRLAVQFSQTQAVSVEYADADDDSATLSTATWSTVGSASTTIGRIAESVVAYTAPASTNDQDVMATDSAIGISGDIEIICLFKYQNATGTQKLGGNWFFGVTKSWNLEVINGTPRLSTSGTGGGDSFMSATTGLSTPGYSAGDWLYLKANYDVSASQANFATSDDGVNWTTLGSAVSGNQTAINTTSTSMCMFQDIAGDVDSTVAFVELYNGIDGTLAARCDASDSSDTTSAFTGDLDGLSWDPQGSSLTRTEYGRTWNIDSGTDRVRLIELRILDGTTEKAAITSSSVTSAAAGSTYTEDSIAWNADSGLLVRASGDWDDITSSARIPEGGVSFRRGRSTDQGLHLAGELTAVLDNRTREFEPGYAGSSYWPKVRPLTPCRFRGTYSGTTYPLWSGLTRQFLPRYDDQSGNDSVSELAGVDAFRLFNIATTGGALGTVLTGLSPVAMWPMTDTGSTFDDTIGTNHLTPTGVTKGSESPFFGGKNRVGYWDGTADATDTAADSAVEITGDCSIAFVINTTVGGDYHIMSAYGTNGCYFGLELDIAETQQPIARWIRNDGTPTSAGNDVTLDLPYAYFLDGTPHVVVATYDQSADTLIVYVDGAKVATNTDAVPAANGTPVVAGTPTIKVGEEGTHGSGTSNFVGLFGYLAVFNKVLTDGEALTITRCRIDGFRSQTPAARINALLDAYGWPTTWRDIDTASTVEPADPEAILDGVESAWANANANIDVIIPAGAQVGGYAYAGIAWPSNRTMDTVPSGWTSVETAQSGSTFEHVEMGVWRKAIADGDPGSTHTFVRSNSAGGHSWCCVAVSEVDTSTQESDSGTNTGASSASIVAPTVTAADGDLLLTFHTTFSITTTLTSFSSGPAGMTLAAEENATNKASVQRSNIGVWYESNLAAGATGTKTATRSAAEPFACASIAVNAATPSGANGSLSAKDMTDASFLTELQAVAEAEGGEFYIAETGKPTFHSRTWRADNSTTVQIEFGNVSTETDYQTVSYRYDEQQIINESTVTDADGGEATVRDEDSIALYGLRSDAETVDLSGASASQTRAQLVVDTYANPRLLLDRLQVFPESDAATLYPALMQLGLGERIRVKHRPPGWTSAAAMLDQQSYPEQFEVSVVRGTSDWTWRIAGSPAPTIMAQILDLLGGDLHAYWPLDDASGRSRDLSGNDEDMTSVTGSITREATGPFAGELATSGFGIGNYESVTEAAFDWDMTAAWTIGVWVKVTAFYVGTASYADILLLSKETWGTNGARLWFYPSTGVNLDTIALSDSNNQTSTIYQPNGANGDIADSTWYHIAATYDGSGTLTLYVDGVATGTLSETVVAATSSLNLGGGWSGSNADGTGAFTASHAFIADRVLTAAEITELASYSP